MAAASAPASVPEVVAAGAEAAPQRFRKTRLVCISDTHNTSPRDGCFKLPPGDVLIHAGDLTNQGTLKELKDTLDWIEAADFEVKIVVAGELDRFISMLFYLDPPLCVYRELGRSNICTGGVCMMSASTLQLIIGIRLGNHDITLDAEFYEKNAERFHSRYPQSVMECRALFGKYPSITYLEHEPATVHLSDASGPQTNFKVFASPYSPTTGKWAFGYESLASGRQRTADVAKGEQSQTSAPVPGHKGELLWSAIPCDTDILITHTPPMGYRDAGRDDRSCKALRRALRRVRPRVSICGHVHEGWGAELINWNHGTDSVDASGSESHIFDLVKDGKKLVKVDLTRSAQTRGRESEFEPGYSGAEFRTAGSEAEATGQSDELRKINNGGGIERMETCVVNAAIMAHSKGAVLGGKKYNKPIVVDLNLPVK